MPRKVGRAAGVVVAPESHLRRSSHERDGLRIPLKSEARIADKRDAHPSDNGDNDSVVKAHSRRPGQAAHRRRIAAPQPLPLPLPLTVPILAGASLGLIATGESIVRSAVTGVSAQHAAVLCIVALASTLPLAFATRQTAAITVVTAGVVSLALFHTLTVAAVIAQLIVLYRLAIDGSPAGRAQAIAVCLPLSFLALALTRPVPSASEAGALTLLLACFAPAAALAGVARRAQDQARRNDAARKAAAGDLLEHAARSERAQIARELHDIVAHHISMISVQAESARMATPGLPPAGAQRLAAIGDTARAALTEMRRLLGVLREDTQTDAANLRPQPGLEQLNELLDQARDASGSAARLILSGSPAPLDPGVELAAYRIVQEALTNARRHAPGAGVDVELRYTDHVLTLRIRDNGPGPPAAQAVAGLGLSGMRERAAAVGGQLHTGAAAGGGFLVKATLPADTPAPGT
jgi:signal transduction histidine kinase